MLTWTEKGERLDGEMHSIHLFSDAYTRQVEALTQKSPFRRFIQSTHNIAHESFDGKYIPVATTSGDAAQKRDLWYSQLPLAAAVLSRNLAGIIGEQ
jgi:hypothetical protein